MGTVLDHRPNYSATGNQDIGAKAPIQLSYAGWRSVMVRVYKQMQYDHTYIIASGIAFNAFLAVFPLIIAAVSLYGLTVDPLTLQDHISTLTSVMPLSAAELVEERLRDVARSSNEGLGWGFAAGLLISLWAANRGTKALFEGLNIAYNQQHGRGFIRKTALTLLVTTCGLIFGGICLLLIAGLPIVADSLPLPAFIIDLIEFAIWPLLFAMLVVVLGLLYKIAPVRSSPQAKWVTVGSLVAGTIWIVGSALFSYFVSNFANYDKTYGSIAAVVVLMLWLFLTSYIVLLGAEINSEIELQTAEDTTVGKEKPMGDRNAYHADHVVD